MRDRIDDLAVLHDCGRNAIWCRVRSRGEQAERTFQRSQSLEEVSVPRRAVDDLMEQAIHADLGSEVVATGCGLPLDCVAHRLNLRLGSVLCRKSAREARQDLADYIQFGEPLLIQIDHHQPPPGRC